MTGKSRLEVELNVLDALQQDSAISQHGLARRLLVSVGLINAVLKRAVRKGMIKVRSAPLKRYGYYVTPRGLAEKSKLVSEYLEVSLHFFRQACNGYRSCLEHVEADHRSGNVVLIGSGELPEMALIAAREMGVEINSIFDPTTNHPTLYGLPVLREESGLSAASAVLIVESRYPQDAFDAAAKLVPPERIYAPDFLYILRPSTEAEQTIG